MTKLLFAATLAAALASSTAFAPGANLPRLSFSTRPANVRCSMSNDDRNADKMLKLSLRQIESIKGREGLQGEDAERAISDVKLAAGGKIADEERKLLGSRRLAKAMGLQKIQQKDQRNEEIAFNTMINSLQSMLGRDGFKGQDAENALRELKEVDAMAKAEEQGKMPGSRKVYKFVRAATRTIMRPIRRKNHPGETWHFSRR